ncbi:uncharacterized protein B0T23DRAFT_415303 [Neurospora hispaniola]|uniref:Secreted protein n=1 Tax=Neurospora hispaniola TaxID=588809 RepID=A0AAJ0I0M2_9PEZI|nr:hypothetical protein B0T23DRAFT_415303 [Neurospora hispaniola]
MIMKIYFYWCVLLLASCASAFVDRDLKLGNQGPSSPANLAPPLLTSTITVTPTTITVTSGVSNIIPNIPLPSSSSAGTQQQPSPVPPSSPSHGPPSPQSPVQNALPIPYNCASPVPGLSPPDCTYLSTIGVISQGQNALSAASGTAGIYLGTNGPNTFSFINGASVPLILVVWYNPVEDAQSSFMDARTPKITYSLPTQGNAVVVSIDNEVPGGWSTLYNYTTTLTEYGQVNNTFGEFNTGSFATTDVSRLVNMQGHPMTVVVRGSGCRSDMQTCVYTCSEPGAVTCGRQRSYRLENCQGQPGAVVSNDANGNPTGGCQGWSNGGHVDVIFT